MAKLKDGFYKQTAEAIGSDLYVLLAGGGMKPLADFANTSSVDYAAKAGDSDKLGGLPASSYLKILSLSESTNKLLSSKVWSAGTTNKGDDSTQNECPTYYGMYLSLQYDTAKNQGYQFYGNTYTSTPTLYVRNRCAGNSHMSYNEWKQIAFISDIPTSLPANGGTADFANKLTTPRTIWGQSFDGSGDVSGIAYFPNGDLIYAKDEGGTYRYVMGLTSGLSFGYGSASAGIDTYILGKNIHFRYYDTDYKYAMSIKNNGNVLIGSTTDSGSKLSIYANGANGRIKIYSSGTEGLNIGQWDGVTNRFESYGRPMLFTAYDAKPIMFGFSGDGNALTLNPNGNVLISTTTDNGAKLQVGGNALIKETTIDAGYVTAHTPSASGWYTVAQVSGYFNFDIYISGGWNHGMPSTIRANICNINGTSYIVQLAGYAGGLCSAIRLGRVSTNVYDVQVYIQALPGPIAAQVCSFIGYGELTTYATGTISTTTYSVVNELSFKTISGRYYTETETDNRYLKLSGGILSDSWSGGTEIRRRDHNNGYVKLSFSRSDGTIMGAFGFGGVDNPLFITQAGGYNPLIHSGNIGSYNAGSATKLQTARTIWGQGFDGTGDISGDFYMTGSTMSLAGDLTGTNTNASSPKFWLGAFHPQDNFFTGSYIQAIGDSGYGNHSISFFTKHSSDYTTSPTERMRINSNGNVGIGITNPTEKLHINGNFKIQGVSNTSNQPDIYLGYYTSWQGSKYPTLMSGYTSKWIMHFNPHIARSDSSDMPGANIRMESTGGNYYDLSAAYDGNNYFRIRYNNNRDLITVTNAGSLYTRGNAYIGDGNDAKELYIQGSTSSLRLFAWNNSTYIESGNKDFSANVPLYITGISGGMGSNLYLNFNNVYCRNGYTNIDSGNISSQSVNYANSAGNADTLDGFHVNTGSTGKCFGKIPVIGSDGVTELGHYIDWHYDNTTTSDFSTRLYVSGNYGNTVCLPSASGTLALTSQIPTSLPANGGNADTVDNKHASDFVLKTDAKIHRWSSTIKGQTWSRLYTGDIDNVLHHSSMFSISGSIGCVVFSQTFLVVGNHSYNAKIIQLNGGSYTQCQMRALVNSGGTVLIDMYWVGNDCSNSTSTNTMTINVNAFCFAGGITPTTSFTSDATIPSGYSDTGAINTRSNCMVLHEVYAYNNIYASHFYETSDINFKENIKAILNSDNIPVIKEFDWKSDGTHSYGLIAQELEEQGYSELVSDSGSHKTVNYSAALSLIVGKLQVKIKELEKEIENLKKSKND